MKKKHILLTIFILGLSIVLATIIDIHEQNNSIIYKVEMEVECRDYLIDINSNEVIR